MNEVAAHIEIGELRGSSEKLEEAMTRIRMAGPFGSELIVKGSFDEILERIRDARASNEPFVEFERDSGKHCWLNPRWISAAHRVGEPSNVAVARAPVQVAA